MILFHKILLAYAVTGSSSGLKISLGLPPAAPVWDAELFCPFEFVEPPEFVLALEEFEDAVSTCISTVLSVSVSIVSSWSSVSVVSEDFSDHDVEYGAALASLLALRFAFLSSIIRFKCSILSFVTFTWSCNTIVSLILAVGISRLAPKIKDGIFS